MDENKVIELLLEMRDRMTRVESKLDAYNGLNQKLDRLEGRICTLEAEPGNKWNKLTTAILGGIGTLIAGGIVTAIVLALQK